MEENFSIFDQNENNNLHINYESEKQRELDSKNNVDLNSNLFTTKFFIKSVDLQCENHLKRFQEEVEATRYCKKCNIICCDTCAIEYHINHISLAKQKIQDFLKFQKELIIHLDIKIQELIKYKINEKEIDSILISQQELIQKFFSRRREEIEIIKKKLESINECDTELEKKLLKSIEVFYKDECYKRLIGLIEKNETFAKKVTDYIKEFSTLNKKEKINALKNNNIYDFGKESDNNIRIIKEEMGIFNQKSLAMQKKLNYLLNTISENNKLIELDKAYSKINEQYLNIMKDISDLKYDKLIIQKIQDIQNKKIDYINNDYKNIININNINQKILLYFNDNKINKDIKLKEINNKNNEIKIYVHEFEKHKKDNVQNSLKLAKDIICPTCGENCLFMIKNYKIILEKCDNGHSLSINLSLNDFNKTQIIKDISCNECCKVKMEGYNNQFYKCYTCNMNLCPLCVLNHNKDHIIIDYALKNYICKTHGQRYILYCKECGKNLCNLCGQEHNKSHFLINFKNFPSNGNIKLILNDLRLKINCFKNEMEKIINKITDGMETCYKIGSNIINNYNIYNNNFQILMNLNNINNYSCIIKDIEKIINENKIEYKLKYVNEIYEKISCNLINSN